jgi:hypothetical protein
MVRTRKCNVARRITLLNVEAMRSTRQRLGTGDQGMGAANNGTVDLSLMDPILAECQSQEGALIPVLQKAQGIYGNLPAEV